MAVTQKVKDRNTTETTKRKPQGSNLIAGSHPGLSNTDSLADHYSLPFDNIEIGNQLSLMNDDKIQTAQRQSMARKIGRSLGNIQLQRMTGSSKRKEEEAEPEEGLQELEEPRGEEKPDIEEPNTGKGVEVEREVGGEPIKEKAPIENEPEVKLKTEEAGEETLETQPEKALESQAKPGGLTEPKKEAIEVKLAETPLETPAEQAEGKTTGESLEKESPAADEGGRGALTATEPAAGEGGPAIPPAVENAPLQAPTAGGPRGPLQALADQVNTQRQKIEGAVRSGQTQLILDGITLKAILSGILLARRLEVDSAFKTKSTELEALRKDQKNKIETQRLVQRQAIEQGYQAKLAGLVQVYNKRFVEMGKLGDSKALGVSHYANRRGAWLSAQTLTNVQRGLQIGENKARSYKDQKRGLELGAMARKVASRWSSNISKMGGEIYFAIIKEGNEKATEIRDMASKVANKFASGVLETQKALRKIRDQALAKIDESAKAALARVDPLINQAQAVLVACKGIVFTNLQRLKMGFQVSTDIAVAKGISVLSIAGRTRINDLDEDYTNLSGTVAMAESEGRTISPTAIETVNSQYTSAGSTYSGEITRGSTFLRGMLFGSLALVTSRLSTLVSRLEGNLAKLIGGISAGLEDMIQKSGMGKITENTQTTMGSVVTKLDTQLGEATSKAGVEFDKAVNTSQQSIDQKALQTQAVETQHLGEMDKQIDAKIKDMQRRWYARVGLAVIAVLSGVLLAAWKLIKGLGQAIAIIALVLVAILAVVGIVFGVLALLVGSATAALVALLVGVVLAAVVAIAAVGMMIYSLVKAAYSIAENFATAYTDDTLTTFQRGTHAGEAAGDIAANVLPNIPKVGRGLNRGIGASFKWLGSKMGARATGAASTIATKTKGLYTKSKDILMANKPFEKVATAASKARTFLKREVKLDEKGRPYLAPAPKPPPELAATLPAEKAPTPQPGEAIPVREPRGRGVGEAEFADTMPAGEAPTLKPGEAASVRGPGERGPMEGGGGGPPRGRPQRGMGPPGPPLPPGPVPPPPKLVRRFENDEAALAEALTQARQGKPYNIASPNSLREQWGILGEAGKPPPAWIDTNGSLWIDGERVLGWWGGTKPAKLLPSGPGPIYSQKTVPYAESPILNRPGANVPAELVKTLPPEAVPGVRPPGPTLPPGGKPPPGLAPEPTLPPGGNTRIGMGPPSPPPPFELAPNAPAIRGVLNDPLKAQKWLDMWINEMHGKFEEIPNQQYLRNLWRAYGRTGEPPILIYLENGMVLINNAKFKVPVAWRQARVAGGSGTAGLRPGPSLPPGSMPPGSTTMPPGGGTQPGLGLSPTLPPETMPSGAPTAPYPRIDLGPRPPGTTPPGTPTAPYPRMDLGPRPPGTTPPGTPTAPNPRIDIGPRPPGTSGRSLEPASTSEVTQVLTRPPMRETPLTLEGLIKWFEQLFNRKSKIKPDDLHVLPKDKFEEAYKAITHDTEKKTGFPEAFTDPKNGQIYVDASYGDVAKLHELIHQFAVRAKTREGFLAKFGAFMEEVTAEGLLRQRLGITVKGDAYKNHMDFFEMLSKAGIKGEILERAYLDGNYDLLVSALMDRFGKDPGKVNHFIKLLRDIGEKCTNEKAHLEAVAMLDKGDYVHFK